MITKRTEAVLKVTQTVIAGDEVPKQSPVYLKLMRLLRFARNDHIGVEDDPDYRHCLPSQRQLAKQLA